MHSHEVCETGPSPLPDETRACDQEGSPVVASIMCDTPGVRRLGPVWSLECGHGRQGRDRLEAAMPDAIIAELLVLTTF